MKEKKQTLFPSRIAKGGNFCNRVDEKKRIRNNINNIQHTLIVSPRRYGKTSLALQSIHEARVVHAYIQFFNAFRDEIVLKRFVDGLNQLLAEILPKSKKALLKFSELMSHATASFSVKGFSIELGIKTASKSPVDIIKGYLYDIEKVLKKKKEYAVIFLDEFQDIVESDSSDELQAMLRDFAQITDYVTFIISGSHHHMLSKMFEDSNKPFYKLLDRIDLHRISEKDYSLFIQKLAEDRWNSKLPNEVINEVLLLTECHAYYVNRLCSKLWELNQIPNIKDVHRIWKLLAEEEFSAIANNISSLTKNQRIVLQTVAKYDVLKEPNSISFLNEVRLSARSVLLALEALKKTDHIERIKEGYRVIDPVIKHVLIE